MAQGSGKGWTFDYDLRVGGVVLQNVRHEGFSLANDIRVVRVWTDTTWPSQSGSSQSMDFVLNSPELPVDSSSGMLEQGEDTTRNPVTAYTGYAPVISMYRSYTLKNELLAGKPNAAKLQIGQRYLFTEYGKKPAHEPGAVLDAARLFPIVSFKLPPVKDKKAPCPRYVRIDYRIDVALDNITSGELVTKKASSTDILNNKAAIFRDSESLPGVIGAGSIGLRKIGSAMGLAGIEEQNVRELFSALEKPLRYEIAAYGLTGAFLPSGFTPATSWDNVHFWAAKRGWRDRVSTPGAFHAIHLHWRWGAIAGGKSLSATVAGLDAAGDPQFRGVGWTEAAGGPLIDPKIRKQNLAFAVTKNDRPEWAATAFPRLRFFTDAFEGVRKRPDEISSGGDLVLWLSFEAYRSDEDLDTSWSGSFFPQGLYFGHNPEKPPASLEAAGAYGESANPTPQPFWRRSAHK